MPCLTPNTYTPRNTRKFTRTHTNTHTKPTQGFSLVELLVVVAILAILAAIAIPLFLNQRSKASQGAVLSDARNLATNITTVLANLPSGVSVDPSLSGDVLTLGGESVPFTPSSGVTVSLTTAPDPANGSGLKIFNPDDPAYACTISFPATVQLSWATTVQPNCGTVISEQGNLLTYGEANATATSWNNYATDVSSITNSDLPPAEGNNTLRVQRSPSPLYGNMYVSQGPSLSPTYGVAVETGKYYTFSYWHRSDPANTNTGSSFAEVVYRNAAGAWVEIHQGTIQPSSTSEWNRVVFTTRAPAGAETLQVRPYFTSLSSNHIAYVSGMQVNLETGGVWEQPGVPTIEP